MARLEIVTGGHTGKVFDFMDEVRLGRSPDNDFCLPDTLVSRYHARITRNGPHFILEDLNSLNGTSRRGTRVPPATPCLLVSGDSFEIGSMRIVFYDQSFQEPLGDHVPATTVTGDQAGQTIPLGVRTAEALSLRWIEDDIASASIVSTRDAILDLSQSHPDTRSIRANHRLTYRRLQAICQISMKIGMVTDLPVLMPKILDCLFDIYPGAERAAILLCTAGGTDLEPAAFKIRGGQAERQQELELSRTIVNDVLHHQHAILSNDMLNDDRFKDQVSVIAHATRSIMCTPLLAEHHTLGLIQLDTHHGPARFTEDDLDILSAISAQVAMAVKNAQLLAQLRTANVALQREMTERQQANARSSQAQAQALEAQAANIAKSQFLATISHEIRTPLSGVIGLTELLSDTSLNAEQEDYVGTIRQCSKALLALINDILDCSRIEAGKLTLEAIAFEIRTVVEEVCAIVAIKARDKGLNLTHHTHPNVPQVVWGDINRLRQILLNLVSNAVKFTDRGDIAIDLSQIARTQDSIYLRFTVSDTGMGIAPEAQTRIFQAFEQADGSITRQYGGSGLGLAISRQLTHLTGGDIGFDSIPGQGSVFWFTVCLGYTAHPEGTTLVPSPPAQPTQALSVPSQCQIQKHFLLVEDSPVNQKVAVMMMEKLGCEVDVVANGRDAIRAVQRGTYDLIFMDCQMPEMDGLTASAAIRQYEAGAGGHIPIIAMTANAMQEDRERCFAAGMDDFVSKPVQGQVLLGIIERWT